MAIDVQWLDEGRGEAVCGPENPHELLGLSPRERDQGLIIAAAQWRLRLLRVNRGSEVAVVRELVRQITAAREAMLTAAREAACCPRD